MSDNPKDFTPAGDVLDPLKKGMRVYMDVYERLAEERNSWKKISQKLMFLVIIMSFGIVYISMRSEYIPFMVRIDGKTGFTEAVGPIKEIKYDPKEAEIIYFLGEFIRNIRTVPLDPVVFKSNWTAATDFLSVRAGQKLNKPLLAQWSYNLRIVTIHWIQ